MRRLIALGIVIVFAAAGLWVAAASPMQFGKPAATDMDDHFIMHGQAETGANNIVTSVVFDYRAIDTLGEAAVLFTAVLGVGLMMRHTRRDEEADQ